VIPRDPADLGDGSWWADPPEDLGRVILQLGRVHWDLPVGGWGRVLTPDAFAAQAMADLTGAIP
jgi:hypothetical protein